MLNGALTIGTLDGANIEMLEECGAENMYTFGFTVEQVQQRRQQGYNPYENLKNEELRLAIEQIRDGYFSPDDQSRFHDIIDTLLTGGDHWMVLGDYQSYIDKQYEVSKDFLNPQIWYSKCIHNIGAAAKFSSDRTIEEYAKDIWLDYYFILFKKTQQTYQCFLGIAHCIKTDDPITSKKTLRQRIHIVFTKNNCK
jgi:starch phosphorylase